MDSNAVAGLIFILLGGGGTMGIGLLFKMLRDHRQGRIEDDGTTIDRLNKENKGLVARAEHAEEREDIERLEKQDWMTQALAYRMQLAASSVKPNDDPRLWVRNTPAVEFDTDSTPRQLPKA